MKTKDIQNNFGKLSGDYVAVRRGYPEDVFVYLSSVISEEAPIVLDVGCGTGISTKQLKEHGFKVTGCDKEEDMLAAARTNSGDIKYIKASADTLPFDSGTFDLVTAFTSLHWFADEKSMLEMRRVMKKGGHFCYIIKKNDESKPSPEFWEEYDEILFKYLPKGFSDLTSFDPKELFIACGFKDIRENVIYTDEFYTIEDALKLNRSFSWWNLLDENDKPKMIYDLHKMYERYLIDGKVLRSRKIEVAICQK